MKPDRAALEALTCRPRLAALAAAPAGPDTLAEYAVVLGRCRLFGVDAPPLPPARAAPAAEALLERLAHTRRRAEGLARVWDNCLEIDEALSASHAVIEERLDAWAALVALEEADAPEDLLTRAWDEVAEIDGVMQDDIALFACVADTGELALWRAALAAEHADPPPWFLSGVIEAESAEARAAADAAVARAISPALLTWHSPDGTMRATLRRLPDGCEVAFDPAPALEGRAVWLGGLIGAIERGRAVIRVPEWQIGPGLELAVGRPGNLWRRHGSTPATLSSEEPSNGARRMAGGA